jgi:hypothetical protein
MTPSEGDVNLAADPDAPADVKPRTATVLGLLVLTSLTISYVGAYAVSGALKRAEIIRPWPPGTDPRLRWLLIGFVVLLASFGGIAALVRYLSRRQLRQIDEMAEDDPRN